MATPPSQRQARPEDASALLALQREIYREGSGFVGDGPPSLEALTRRLRALEPSQALYLVAGSAAGRLFAWLELSRHGPSRMRHVAVLTLAVAPGQRRRGLARALLREGYRWAEQVGVEKIALHVRAGNRPAIGLYEAEGFVLEGCECLKIRRAAGQAAR